jgi:hypothetical protein
MPSLQSDPGLWVALDEARWILESAASAEDPFVHSSSGTVGLKGKRRSAKRQLFQDAAKKSDMLAFCNAHQEEVRCLL